MVSKAREDLPEPDRPVMTISRSRGRSRSMFLRVWVRAPRMRMVSIAIWQGPGWDSGGWEAGGRQAYRPAYRPVMRFSRSRGRSRSMFVRLWVRAPRMRMLSIAIWQGPGWDSGGGEAGGRQGNPPAYRAARGGANARIPARPAPVPPAGTAV